MSGQRTGTPRGSAPRPTQLKLLEGVKPSRINTREPVVSGTARPDPAWSKDARVLWDSIAPPMIRAGILSPVDVPAFGDLLELIVVMREYRRQMVEEIAGTRVVSPGTPPAVYQFARVAALVNSGLTQYGMTPASRSRLIASGVDDVAGPGRGRDLLSN